MNKKLIDKPFYRFLYINTWAFVLIGLGFIAFIASVLILLLTNFFVPAKIYFFVCSLTLTVCGFVLLSKYKKRMQLYRYMMKINCEEFHPESFRHLMNHLCGRKLTKVILHDLKKDEEWKNLKKLFPLSFAG